MPPEITYAPIYKDADAPNGPGTGHRGLWFDRYFNRYLESWALGKTAKLDWIENASGVAGDQTNIKAAALRARQLCSALHGDSCVYSASWHFATGLGNPHPVENGFQWHPTLGVPYIPGAAVKGLIRAWVESWEDFDNDDNKRRATLYRWFGSEGKDPVERRVCREKGFVPPAGTDGIDTETGSFIFFDALPVAPVTLKPDIMTPHMGEWYAEGDQITDVTTQSDRVPADWHSPVPVPFLVADKPDFQFCIAPRGEAAKLELEQVFKALEYALECLGAGAKTAVGYGRFEPDIQENKRIAKERSAIDLSKCSLADRIRALNENELAELLGKNKNSTKDNCKEIYGIEWLAFLDQIEELHGDLLRSWQVDGSKHQKGAYKTVFNRQKE